MADLVWRNEGPESADWSSGTSGKGGHVHGQGKAGTFAVNSPSGNNFKMVYFVSWIILHCD